MIGKKYGIISILNEKIKRRLDKIGGKKMTEKEKRDRQELYDGNYDAMLLEERIKVKEPCFEYNHLRPSCQKERKKF